MDEAQFKKIMENIEAPASDQNAQKRAVSLAMSEFKAHQKKSEKKSQGFSFLSRLMGKTNKEKRNDPMEKTSNKRMMYGGMATAMAVVLIAGGTLTQTQNFGENAQQEMDLLSQIQLTSVELNKADDQTFVSAGKMEQSGAPAAAPLVSIAEQLPNADESMSSTPPQIVSQDTRLRSKKEARESQGLQGSANRSMLMEEKVSSSISGGGVKNAFAKTKIARHKPNAPVSTMMVVHNFVGDMAMPAPAFDHDAIAPPGYKDVGRDQFEDFKVNSIKRVSEEPVSTFSTDVDTASYSFMRRQVNNGVLPQKDAVRVEEMINYFNYNYAVPDDTAQPFKPTVTITDSPWAEGKQLMHIGIKGYEITGEKPKSNLVFLLDVSGSMNAPDKLPLVKNSMKMLLDTLNPDDTVSIVVYAGAAGAVLEPTKVSEKGTIMAALNRLNAGGSTAGAAGINLAYQLAEQNFDENAVNRVILATDGDFNVGIRNREELKDFVERKRETGIFLSVLGFGQGNYNDHMMQTLAQNGNGVAAYIDSLSEARKVLVDEASSSLFTIAKDVKIQVEFNPKAVSEYRLIGYETRALNREDFNNDKIDAGDIGAGHTVTAIYEITPVDSEAQSVDALRYGSSDTAAVKEGATHASLNELAFLKIRYKLPKEDTSKLITTPITTQDIRKPCPSNAKCIIAAPNADTIFATAVAGFGQLLQGGQYIQNFTYDDVIALAQDSKGADEFGHRAEFINLVRLAKSASDMQ